MGAGPTSASATSMVAMDICDADVKRPMTDGCTVLFLSK